MEYLKIKLDLPMTKGGASNEGKYADYYKQQGVVLRAKYRRPK